MPRKKLFLTNKDMPEDVIQDKVFPGFYVTNPHMPFYMFTPVVLAMFYIAIFHTELLWWQILIGIGVALAFWPFFEYTMHRYMFHWKPKSAFFRKLVYTIHSGHHDYPNDDRLMLVGPIVSIPAFIIFLGVAYLVSGSYAFPFMGGIAAFYMFYDWLHYASHHYNFDNKIFQALKVHHIRHHYEDNDKNFAFTILIWDSIFGTRLANRHSKKQKHEH